MKTLTLLMVLLLSLPSAAQMPESVQPADSLAKNLVAVTEIPEKTIAVKINDSQVVDLYDRFARHYAGFIKGKATKAVDFDFLMGAKNAQTAFELFYLFGLALDQGMALDQFADFGLIPTDDGNFSFSLEESPHLVEPSQLFRRLYNHQFYLEKYSKPLLTRGFRPSDITIIEQHIKNHDIDKEIHIKSIRLAQKKFPTIKQIAATEQGLTGQDFIDTMQAWSYQLRYINYNTWRNWGLDLLSQLDPQRQRILKSFLVETLSGDRYLVRSRKDTELYRMGVKEWAKAFYSGAAERQLNEQIQQMQQEGLE